MATSQTKAPETLTEAQIKKIKTDNTNLVKINKESEKQNQDLMEKYNGLAEKLAELNSKLENSLTIRPQFNEVKTEKTDNIQKENNKKHSMYDEITIVHLCDNPTGITTHIELTSTTIDFSVFGEERTLTVQQFEELAGKYRSWFDVYGFLAVGSDEDSEYYAKKQRLNTIKDLPFGSNFLTKLKTMNVTELEDIWNKLNWGHRDFIISYFKRKFIEKDPAFRDIYKLQTLNRLSDNSLANEIQELTRPIVKTAR